MLADRYQETGLSRQCIKVIRRGLNDENVIRILAKVYELGLLVVVDALMDVCMSYVVSHFYSISRKNIDLIESPFLIA